MNYIKLLWSLYQLKRNTKKTKEEIKALQEKKLRRLLHYAYDHSTYYRTRFEQHGITKALIDQTSISKFPTMNKQRLMKHFDELVTVDGVVQEELRRFDEEEALNQSFKDGYHVVHSSGSTGKPGYFIYDDHAWNQMLLGIIRGALWDMSMMDILRLLKKTPRIVYIAASDGRYGGAMAVTSGIEGVGAKQLTLDVKQPLNEWVDQIQTFDPNIMIGYSSAIKILAELVEAGNINMNVERIISCGEPLSKNLRTYLEHIFHCDVVNFYGASESLALGVEIAANEGMYLFDDLNYIEVENGKLYITSLYNFAQPLIRYELSDCITFDHRAGRNPFTRIQNITGRHEDLMWFEDASGNREFLHPLAVEGFCLQGMLDYQFVQENEQSFSLHIEVSDDRFKNTINKEMKTSLQTLLTEKHLDYVTFTIEFVNEILPSKDTGKKQLIVKQKGRCA